ncbi:MAG: hypothetical protein JSV36_21330 [Anaerolineae bacterium]|nr:MAG: hypothetical protein JSV36_21330 [Anaerolineae bacterium]
MSKILWEIVGGLEKAVEWLGRTTTGRIVAAAIIVLIGVLVALITAEPAFGIWTILLLTIGLVLAIVLRRK